MAWLTDWPMVLSKIAQELVHGTIIGPHDGHQWSMMNLKMPGIDHRITAVDVAQKIAKLPSWTKNWSMIGSHAIFAWKRNLPLRILSGHDDFVGKFDMPWCAFRSFCFTLDLESCQSPWTTETQSTIERIIILLTMSNLENWAADKGTVVKPNKMAEEMIESNSRPRTPRSKLKQIMKDKANATVEGAKGA